MPAVALAGALALLAAGLTDQAQSGARQLRRTGRVVAGPARPAEARPLRALQPGLAIPRPLTDARFSPSPFLLRHRSFDGLRYSAMGVVTERWEDRATPDALSGEGAVVHTCVVSGRAGQMNYRTDGSWDGPGDISEYAPYGGDSTVSGNPQPGDVVRWQESAGYGYGWVSFLVAAERSEVLAAVGQVCRGVTHTP